MIKNNLINDIIAATGNKLASTADESKILNNKYAFNTDIPALNIAMTGDIDGKIQSGLLMIAGPSKHFKTCYMLKICASFIEQNPDGLMVLFDSEGGASINYLKAFGIPMEKVIHIPISNIEELKTQHLRVLKKLNRGDKVIFAVDSIGNLASLKETDDAEEGKTVADMTRAKQLKSYGRIITPELINKDLFMIAVNHTYKTMELYSKDVVGGGTGLYYSANDIWIVGRSQEKDGDELVGYTFTIKIEKSRSVVEQSKIPITVKFDGGIDKYSGLLDIALEGQFIIKPSNGWYQLPDTEQKVRAKDIAPLLDNVLDNPDFKQYVRDLYKLHD
jgi:hypothetical protein